MRFLNVNTRKIEEVNDYIIKEFIIEDGEQQLELPMSISHEGIRRLMETEKCDKPVLARVEIGNVGSAEDFEMLCDLVVNSFINNNSTKEVKPCTEERGHFEIPEELNCVNCTILPLINAINKVCLNDCFAIEIVSKPKEFEYILVGEGNE